MNRTKVLFISPSPEFAGGISRWTGHILSKYEQTPCDIELDYLCQSNYKNAIKRQGLRRIISGTINYLKVIHCLRKRLKTNHYDTIHLNTSASLGLIKDLIVLRLCHRHKTTCILHFHFGRIPELAMKNNWEWKLIKRTIKRATTTIVMDCRSQKTLSIAGFKDVINLPNPIADRVLETVNQSSIIIEKRNITFVGQMLSTKGIFELIEACREIKDIKLNMYGLVTPTTIKELQTVAGANHTEWLNIVGEIPYTEVIEAMQRCEVFALPTYTEGFPNVILESMAAGCAIVASDVGAIPEMIGSTESEERCGICIEAKSTAELRQAILWLLDHPFEAQELRQRAKQRVTERYSMDIIFTKLVDIWKQQKTLQKTKNPR